MLTFRQLDDAPQRIVETAGEAEQRVINDFAALLATIPRAGSYREWLTAAQLEASTFARRHFNAAYRISTDQLADIIDEAATRSAKFEDGVYREAGIEPTPISEDAVMRAAAQSGYNATNSELYNTYRFTSASAGAQFAQAANQAQNAIMYGASYQDAIRRAVRLLCRPGLVVGGYTRNPVSVMNAVRRTVLTGVNQTVAEMTLARMDEYDTRYVITSAHADARPTHAIWQGQVCVVRGEDERYPNFYAYTEYGTEQGLCGYNCRHSFLPYWPGVSKPETPQRLEQLNNREVTFNDKTMSLYDATQLQRRWERHVRSWKDEESAFDKIGDKAAAAHARNRVEYWQGRLRGLVKATGLSRDYFREQGGAQLLS